MATSWSTAANTTSVWPPEALEAVPSCPACGSRERALLHSGLRDRLYGAPGTWRLWSCGCCGSAFLDPRPDLESIGRAYVDYFTHAMLRAAGFERVERLRPTADAGWGLSWSAAIARGTNPFEETLPRPSLGLRARAAAADLLSARSPDTAEELMIAAWT
jgi:hypothetical protein